MSFKEADFVRDYINLYILERIGNAEGAEVPFQRKLSTKDLKVYNEDEASTKEKIEAAIQKQLDLQAPKELQQPEIRAHIIDRVYETMNPTLRINFNQMISRNLQNLRQQSASTENFNANLILSEIFMPDANFTKSLLDDPAKQKNIDVIAENQQDFMDVSQMIKTAREERYTMVKFEREFHELDFKSYNNKKLVGFLEMLDTYNMKIDFEFDDLEKLEGLLLKFFYSDEKNLNFYVFRKSVRNFMKKFADHFANDLEARFKAFDMVASPHLILFASYSPHLCEYLDKQEYVEKVHERIHEMPDAHYHLYIKILINFLHNYPFVIDKIISLKLLDRISGPLLARNNVADLTTFAVLLTKASKVNINSKKLLSRSVSRALFEKLIEFTKSYADLKVLAIKYKNHIAHFYSSFSEEPQVIMETYIKDYKELITQKMTLARYHYSYYSGLLLLRFIASANLKYDAQQKVDFTQAVLDYMAVFFYQRGIASKGFLALKQLLCSETYEILLDEFFNLNMLKNCMTIFERKHFSLKTIKALQNLQALILALIETIQMNKKILYTGQIKKIIDLVFKIRTVVSQFYYEVKKKYLSKGLVKYVQKLKKDLRKNLIQPLDSVLSLNGLILQKLSHTQVLDENIVFYTGVSESLFQRFTEKHRMENLIANSSELLYIVSKVDRKEGYLDKVITHNIFMLNKIEDYISSMQSNREMVDFDLVESIIEYLIVNIYFVKTYDEQYKKVSSIKVLKQTVELFVRILESTRTFVDLQSNHQIYILLENLGLFWLLFFDYNYRFYDRLSFVFIDNLKAIFRETDDNKVETFTPQTLGRILTFLNDFVDLKSKNPFLNFIILKQLDTINLTLTNITPMNNNIIVNIFQKVFSSQYGSEIHRMHPKYIISLNIKTLSIPGIKESFLGFITKNSLFINQHTASILKNLLDKNFEINSLGFSQAISKQLFEHTILEKPLASSMETTQAMLGLIQRNIRNKVLFEDLVAVLRKYLKTTDSSYNNEIVRRLFLSESVFLKLVRLYKKDRINLSKVLKYLLLICKHFNFMKEIKIPRPVILSLLNAREVGQFHDVYMLVISYILENNLYNEYKDEIDTFLTNTKRYLDSLLYFSSEINYDRQIKIIYYSLKVLKNCSHALKNIAELADLDSEGFILKYILQLMDENSKLEMVPINNLHHHFRKHQQINMNYKTASFERKIVMMFFQILQQNSTLFDTLIQDFFVVNKLISFSYIVLDQQVFEKFAGLFIRILYYGIRETQKDLFKDVFFDFYLLVYFEFLYESETIEPFVKRHVCENNKLVNSALIRIIDEIKRKKYRFDSMGYNLIIRSLLKIYYITCAFEHQIFAKDYSDILFALDTFLYNNYKDVHALNKLEKLIVSLYIHIQGKAKIKSKNSASVFLYIFNNFVDFKMACLIDRYIYMGLFNIYFKVEKLSIRYFIDKETTDFSKLVDSQQLDRLKYENSIFSIESKKVNEILLQLKLEKLTLDNEIILIKFLEKISSIDKAKVIGLNYSPEIQKKLVRDITSGLEGYYDLDLKAAIGLKRRVNLLLILISKDIASNSNDNFYLLSEAVSICQLIEGVFKSSAFAKKAAEKDHIKFFLRLQKLIYKFYKLASSKNEAYMKPQIMDSMHQTWLAVHAINADHESKLVLENAIILSVIKLMRKRYDEMRIVLFKDFIPGILAIMKEQEEKTQSAVKPEEDKNVFEMSKASNAFEKENGQTAQEEQNQLPEQIPDEPLNRADFSDEYLELLTTDPNNYILSGEFDNAAKLEKCIFIFYQISRNRLLLEMEYKRELFTFIENNKEKIARTNLSMILYKLLKSEFNDEVATLNLDASTVRHSLVTAPNNQSANDLLLSQNKSFFKKSEGPAKEFNDKQSEIKQSRVEGQGEQEKQKEQGGSQVIPKEAEKESENQKSQQQPESSRKSSKVEEQPKPAGIEDLSPLKSVNEKPKDTNENLMASAVIHKKIRESSLSLKQKNILYVHKVFTTLWKNLERKDAITPREEEFLSFGLVALQKHLLENLDPEIFNSLSFFSLVCKFILDDKVNTSFKHECLQILRLYLKSCQHKSGVNPEDTKGLLTFYERLFFDNYSEIVTIYFEVLTLVFQYVKFEHAFLNEYVDHLGFCLFEAYSSISANVFVPALAVYTRVIIDNRLELNIPKISGTVYMFLKLNYKDMKLYERALFTQLLAVYDKNGGLDPTRLNNMCMFVKFSTSMEGYDRIEEALVCFEEITNFYDDFQKLFRVIGFESFYKLVMKKCGDDIQTIRLLSKLFLRYTYRAEENKFEMLEIVKFILKYILKFHQKAPNDEKTIETIILLYKSLVNCALVKENSDYMVRSTLGEVIVSCSYRNKSECMLVVISLLFNICYVFDNGEVDLKRLVNEPLLNFISEVFEDSLEQRNDPILMEIIDLFIGFVQHEYTAFFTPSIIAKMKLALNFYYDSSLVTLKFLSILKDITIAGDNRAVRLVANNFDFIYLYHIHYRNFRNEKINFFVKHIIYNCMVHNQESLTQRHLITYGIPENIIHTFSLENDRNVTVLNLKIILMSLRFEKCQLFVKNHFMIALREILYGKRRADDEQVLRLAIEILLSLFEFFKDTEAINADYYFDDIPKTLGLVALYADQDAYLALLLAVLKSNIEHDKERIGLISPANRMLLQELISVKAKSKSKAVLSHLYTVCNYIDLHASFVERKMNFSRNNALSLDDRTLLETGQSILAVFRSQIHKNALIKFDFLKNKFSILNFQHDDPVNRQSTKKLSFSIARVKNVDSPDPIEENAFEDLLKTYFNKRIKRELYFSMTLFFGEEKNFAIHSVFLIFENEYKMQKWRTLVDVIVQSK